jgi:DNA primase
MQQRDDLGELLEHLDIEHWLDANGVDYIKARGRSGQQLNVQVCPVCGNEDRKVYLNAETGLGNCFAGSHPPGQNFNKWRFIRAHLGELSNAEVIRHIRAFVEQSGWRPRRVSSATVEQPVKLVLPASVPLPHEGRNLKYLTNRGITPEMARYFHLRYCISGVFPYFDDGRLRQMDFSDRVLIPVFDLNGTMVNFQGRDTTGQRQPKYLFPPGLSATGNHLLNGQNVVATKKVVVGEGAFDVIALKMALDEDVALRDVVPIGTFGKHLSYGPGDTQEAKFLELKRRGVEDIVFMWDGEEAATRAAIEAGLRLKGLGFSVRVALLPANKDPNEVPGDVVRKCYYEAASLTMQSAVQILYRRKSAS